MIHDGDSKHTGEEGRLRPPTLFPHHNLHLKQQQEAKAVRRV